MDNIEVAERLTKVETNLDTVMTNHLPHLQAKLDLVDGRLWWILGVIVIGFVANLYWTHKKAR